jgi:hypothetical protein
MDGSDPRSGGNSSAVADRSAGRSAAGTEANDHASAEEWDCRDIAPAKLKVSEM